MSTVQISARSDIDSSSRLVCDHKTRACGRTVLPRRFPGRGGGDD